MAKSKFEVYLQSVLTDAQIGLLKEALLEDRRVYFYGEEGTGKSPLYRVLRESGITRVAEPGCYPNRGPFELPKRPCGIVLMELYGLKKHLGVDEVLEFGQSDIDAWLTA